MRYRCPVCLFPDLQYPPYDYHICPCCGTEFGNDDQEFNHLQLRDLWVSNGAAWFYGQPAADWNPYMQLVVGGHAEAVPAFALSVNTETDMGSPYILRTTEGANEKLALVA
jgi:hypothetical protein